MRREFSAGGVVYKKVRDNSSKVKLFWLVAKSKPSKEYPDDVWRLPKGWLDDEGGGKKPGQLAAGRRKADEDNIRKAALREVEEEGGVEAEIVEKITTDRYFYTDKEKERVIKFVTYYLMSWIKDKDGGFGKETEKVKWLTFGKAKKQLTYSREKKVLEKAKKIMDNTLL